MTSTLSTAPLTTSMIDDVIAGLPIQGRILLKLLLIQYRDISHDEILYMVADRPDPRCVSGTKPITTMTQESIAAMIARRDEYRRRALLRRERTRLQCMALAHLADTAGAMSDRAALLLTQRGLSADRLAQLKSEARSAVSKPALRVLDEQWDKGEIGAEEFQTYRLVIEMQTVLRFAERFRKRLDLAERERRTSDRTVLQDHEVCHIWGIPAGTFAARKVKFLSHYLLALQAKLSGVPASPTSTPSLELWDNTVAVLSGSPLERSIATYDGLEQTESALIEKLEAYVTIGIPEPIELKFWNSLVYGASSNAMHSEITRTLFGLQRLVAIQHDLETSPEALDQILLARTAPTPKESVEKIPGQRELGSSELTEMQKHILHNFIGEDVSGRASDKW